MLMATVGSIKAQSGITSFGGDVRNSSGSLSYTLGQPADRSYCDTAVTISIRTATLTEGVQQPYLTVEQLSVPGVESLDLAISVYPNPNAGEFHIKSSDEDVALRYELYNAAGQQIRKGTFVGIERVDIHNCPAGGYMLKVESDSMPGSRVFRVVKGH